MFYFRTGYVNKHYTPEIWKLREDIEKSKAIKCPDVYTQITNLKYIQYLINREETWLHFGFDRDTFLKNKQTFCDMFTMEDFGNDKQKLLDFVEANGGYSSWVLKPQHEGGGQNYFGDRIRSQVEASSIETLSCYILMKLINVT